MSVKIFSGSSNLSLSRDVSNNLKINLSDIQLKHFKDSEISVKVNENVSLCDCFVIQSLCNNANDNLIELLLICDALRRANANKVTAVIPYLGYMRQDRRCEYGEPISAKLISSIISNYFDSAILIDLHVPQIEGFFDIHTSNLSCFPIFVEDIKNRNDFLNDKPVIVSPDIGALKMARSYADYLGFDLVIVEKKRERANESKIMNVIGNIKGKNAIIIDDMIDTAGTICNVSKFLNDEGAKSIHLYASHAVCSDKAFERLSANYISSITFSDSIPIDKTKIKNLRILSISKLLSNEISKLVHHYN